MPWMVVVVGVERTDFRNWRYPVRLRSRDDILSFPAPILILARRLQLPVGKRGNKGGEWPRERVGGFVEVYLHDTVHQKSDIAASQRI